MVFPDHVGGLRTEGITSAEFVLLVRALCVSCFWVSPSGSARFPGVGLNSLVGGCHTCSGLLVNGPHQPLLPVDQRLILSSALW